MALNPLLVLALFILAQYVLVSGGTLVETAYYKQTVDHFKYGSRLSQETFTQRYYLDYTFWSGPEQSGPILVFFGGESALEENAVGLCGVITESAPQLSALVLYIEHRFYGLSVPYGSIDLAMDDHEVRGCLTTSQALEDYSEIITWVKRNLSAESSPVIVMGASYAGILAALFRFRYPSVATGALASSAPMYFDVYHSNNFYNVISQDFEEINHECYERIRQSWDTIDDMAKKPGGLDDLSQVFRTCGPLLSVNGLKVFLLEFYTWMAQYNGRFSYWINHVCDNVIDPPNGNVLEGIYQAINDTYSGVEKCLSSNTWAARPIFSLDENSAKAWKWQFCSELLIPFHSEQETMFPIQSFSLSAYMASCQASYGGVLRPWVLDFERHDANAILQGYASNIIFSNGLRDPYSSVGVLEDISETVVAINTNQGSHCLDFGEAQADDPKWLVHQRQKETRIFMEWIEKGNNPRSGSPSWKPWLWIIHLVFLWLL